MKLAKSLLAGVVLSLAALPVLGQEKLSGSIKADGSSTVFLITEGMSVAFNKLHPNVKISVAFSGTGGGMKKMANGELDIADASRAIKPAEADKCKEAGINLVELQVAWDGLAVIINPENSWANKITLEQLRKIWHPDKDGFKNAKKWSDVDASWPAEEIKLYGAGSDSGTFDYFTEAVNGKEKLIRADYTPSEDDNVTTNGVIRNKYAMGFLGVAYYTQNKGKLGVAAIMDPKGKDFQLPTPENVLNKSYALSRPLYIYVKTTSLKRPEVKGFVDYYLRNPEIVSKSGYVAMNNLQQSKERAKFQKATAASN